MKNVISFQCKPCESLYVPMRIPLCLKHNTWGDIPLFDPFWHPERSTATGTFYVENDKNWKASSHLEGGWLRTRTCGTSERRSFQKSNFPGSGNEGGVSVFRFYGPHFSHSNVWTVPIFGFHVLRIRRPAGRPAEGRTFVSCEKFSKIPEIFDNFAFVSR